MCRRRIEDRDGEVPPALTIDAERFRDRFAAFNEIGATERGGVNRPSLSAANREARDTLVEYFESAGLAVTVDEMGNLFGRRVGTDPDLAPVLIGSHIDSQYNGGRFDGVVGVLGALEVVESLDDADLDLPRPVEVVAWSNEEGVRFQPDMLGSGVFAGAFDLEFAYGLTDEEGRTFGEELERIGYKGDRPCEPRDLHRYMELHVEQGPVLDEEDIAVGVVEGIYGFRWLRVEFRGQADHAGPTPMHFRDDALVAASDVIQSVRRLTATTGTDFVGTVGSIDLNPNSINVIPERASFTVDIRSYDLATLEEAFERIEREIAWAAEREGVEAEVETLMTIEPRVFESGPVAAIERAAERVDTSYTRLVSGAGHDASYLHDVCPTGMIFVPSVDGISHSEDEYTEWEDIVTGTNVLLQATFDAATNT